MRVLASMIAAVLIAGATVARAHQAPRGWDYPFYCCLDSDCAQIEAEAVREVTGGFVVTIAPGKHPMWSSERKKPLTLEIPQDKAKQSPDGHWHLCIDDSGELLCFFAPGNDS
ncbi:MULTISPECIES: hypothetical protein [Bosea]|jgi:hypothetical protein|uniref:hypothetical protein n=1 Tax=Bosea TaxID=85413 RepID=UPI00215060DD|nr:MULTISPECIES: hypothetical protein [Bosea]MCR4521017.1 hypothetical protein [Bosea sp. 47.2.35]MDR6830662.1 hypothetical protein [Bosea robiniae]MDR6897543.1 hypothetical protein [Bosea sp. BE109]MDR7140940.1 hypothetical protein [Bosea sp. BE168]MDR7177540.1 hypothetical protein [Bosea sp. BE271]